MGAISSDLYRPQSQDEIVEFSFFVALSYEYNLQLGCLWWKISTSSLKTYFTNLVLTFVNLVSRHENCNFPRFTWWKVDERRKMHWVTHIFITDYKKPTFGHSRAFLSICTISSKALFSWMDTSTLMVINWKLTFICRSKKIFWTVNCKGNLENP